MVGEIVCTDMSAEKQIPDNRVYGGWIRWTSFKCQK